MPLIVNWKLAGAAAYVSPYSFAFATPLAELLFDAETD